MTKQLSFHDHRLRTGRGGPRKGAGRKRSSRPVIHHIRRERFARTKPALVTVRVLEGVRSLREKRLIAELKQTFAAACDRSGFRLIHYSIQNDHVHLIVEADDQRALGRGMNAVSARIARAVNRIQQRQGRVLAGRYHARLLESPRQVRNALRYVLSNFRKHARQSGRCQPQATFDDASSARHFEGWTNGRRTPPRNVEVAPAATWLLRVGWQRHGRINPHEVPGPA